ncbi:ssDNA-binding protein, mitochondrial [Orbilia brochopaga]|uniref:SsDNA-binding protein, mitochondrial n=1 Tax=Orbilia brochopaga TaxID=3140254 RepID=A0AAV9V1Q8_9PEZI
MSALRAIRTLPRQVRPARLFSTSTPRGDLARVTLIGRVGTEPEMSQSSNGTQMMKYTLATSSGVGEARQTQWHRILAFGEPHPAGLTKGVMLYIEGDLKTSVYDGEDGKKHTAVTIFQRYAQVIRRPQTASEGGETPTE